MVVMSSQVVAVRLDDALAAHLREWAEMRGETVSTTVRKCIVASIGEPAPPAPVSTSSVEVGGDWEW